MQMKYIALIPAYKPTPVLPDLLEQLKTLGFATVLVDDGSGAEYEDLFFECSRHAVYSILLLMGRLRLANIIARMISI